MSPEAITNIIFGVLMILLGCLEIWLVERLTSRWQQRTTDLESQVMLANMSSQSRRSVHRRNSDTIEDRSVGLQAQSPSGGAAAINGFEEDGRTGHSTDEETTDANEEL